MLSEFKTKVIQCKRRKEEIVDTTTHLGKAVFWMRAIRRAIEADVLRERTMVGLKAARARGKKGGRKSGS